MHVYPYFSTKLTKKKSFYSKHAEEIFKGGVLAMKQKTIWMEWIIQINDMRKTWMKMWMKIIHVHISMELQQLKEEGQCHVKSFRGNF